MNDFEEVTSLIFDLGTFTYKIGTSGNDHPSYSPMPLLGINNDNDMFYSKEEIDSYTNKDMKIIPFMSPSHGGIDNMDLFETFFDDILTNHNVLNDDMTKHPFLFSEPSIHNRTNRMKLTELCDSSFVHLQRLCAVLIRLWSNELRSLRFWAYDDERGSDSRWDDS